MFVLVQDIGVCSEAFTVFSIATYELLIIESADSIQEDTYADVVFTRDSEMNVCFEFIREYAFGVRVPMYHLITWPAVIIQVTDADMSVPNVDASNIRLFWSRMRQ
jgi:hypothetical protein